MVNGRTGMQIFYNDKTDLLYIRLDDRRQPLLNERISPDIVLDRGEDQRVVGIEIMDASKTVDLSRLFPIEYHTAPASPPDSDAR